MKICVADDEREVRLGIIQKLAAQFPDEQIFDVGFGRAALEQIAWVQPELVFLDIRMPELDGLQILHELKQSFPAIYVVIISGYDDFEYARQALHHGALDYLLKPADRGQLREIVEKVREQLAADFATELELLLAKEPEVRQALKEVRPANLSLWYDERQWKRVIVGSEAEMAAREAPPHHMLLRASFDGGFAGIALQADSDAGRGCFREKEAFLPVLRQELQRQRRREFFQIADSAGPGRTVDAKEVVKQSAKLRQEMVQHARTGDFAALERSLEAWFDGLEQASLEELQKECAYLMALLDEGLTKHEVIFLEEDVMYYWSDWVSRHRTWRELKRKISKIALSGVKALKELEHQAEQEPSGSSHWFSQALRMLEHSDDPHVSLESVAEAVNVHPVTLSRIFKQQMGMNFMRYLTQKRMRLARTLLLHTHKKINEIAEEVGYGDYPYFRHVFKKEFGLSPSEFRRNHGLSGE